MTVDTKPAFLSGGGEVPFTLRACQQLNVCPVSGTYDPVSQIWRGAELRYAATRTVTATSVGQDQDLD